MPAIECAECAIPKKELIPNHVLKGCCLRAQVSWIIPAQIAPVLTISPHSLSASLALPLSNRPTAILLIPSPLLKTQTHKPPSAGPVSRVETCGRWEQPRLPTEGRLGFHKVKHFSSTKFQPVQQSGDCCPHPNPHSHLIRGSAPSSSSPISSSKSST